MSAEDAGFVVGFLIANLLFFSYILLEIKAIYGKLSHKTFGGLNSLDDTHQETAENKVKYFEITVYINIVFFFSGYSFSFKRFVIIGSITAVQLFLVLIFMAFNKRLRRRPR